MHFLLQGICWTDRFEDEVNRLLQDRWGEAGYTAVQSHVRAIAKTIWIRSEPGDIRFVVVVDALSIAPFRLDNARCLATVLHELGHVIREESHLQRLGEDEFVSTSTSKERCLADWAKAVIDEFDVDRLVDSCLAVLATTAGGQPLSLREVEEAEGVDWVRTLLKELDALPNLADVEVWKYQTRQMGIEDLAEAVIPEVREILTVLSHTASIYLGTERWPDIAKDIAETEASRRLFREHLDTILGQLGGRDVPFEDALSIVSQAIEGVFRNCGLRFETVPLRVSTSQWKLPRLNKVICKGQSCSSIRLSRALDRYAEPRRYGPIAAHFETTGSDANSRRSPTSFGNPKISDNPSSNADRVRAIHHSGETLEFGFRKLLEQVRQSIYLRRRPRSRIQDRQPREVGFLDRHPARPRAGASGQQREQAEVAVQPDRERPVPRSVDGLDRPEDICQHRSIGVHRHHSRGVEPQAFRHRQPSGRSPQLVSVVPALACPSGPGLVRGRIVAQG